MPGVPSGDHETGDAKFQHEDGTEKTYLLTTDLKHQLYDVPTNTSDVEDFVRGEQRKRNE